MADKPHWQGRNSTILFMERNRKQDIDVMSWDVKCEGEEVQDGICGEDRDRLDFIITHFTITLGLQVSDAKILRRFFELQQQRDQKVLMEESAVGFLIKPNDGTVEQFQARAVVLGGWGISVGGRTERAKLTLPLRAKYFEPVATP